MIHCYAKCKVTPVNALWTSKFTSMIQQWYWIEFILNPLLTAGHHINDNGSHTQRIPWPECGLSNDISILLFAIITGLLLYYRLFYSINATIYVQISPAAILVGCIHLNYNCNARVRNIHCANRTRGYNLVAMSVFNWSYFSLYPRQI